MRLNKNLILGLLAPLMLVGCGMLEPDSISHTALGEAVVMDNGQAKSINPYIVNGTVDNGHPTVGKLNVAGAACTATLIGKHTVLTAGHCVDGSSGTFTLGSKSYKSSKIVRHPNYGGGNNNDVAIVILSQDVTDISPTPINNQTLKTGTQLILVGFGVTSGSANNYGTKRVTYNNVQSVDSTTFDFSGNKMTCYGDSGGPAFIMLNGQEVIAGITSTGDQNCTQYGTDMRVDAYKSWIMQTANNDVVLPGGSSGSNDTGNNGTGSDTGNDVEPLPGDSTGTDNGGSSGDDVEPLPEDGTGNNGSGGTTITPPSGSSSASEGASCASLACASGLECITVYQAYGTVIGKYCMEKCSNAGSDAACESGETCTNSPSGTVCFNPSNPSQGYTTPSSAGSAGNNSPDVQEGDSSSAGNSDSDESAAFALLNQERAKQGLAAVTVDNTALAVARAHSKDMCDRRFFSHTNPDGQEPWDRLKAGGVSFSGAGENIAAGYSSASAVNTGWMNSSGHRQNMLTPSWTRAAIGLYKCGSGYGWYWTEVFMK